MSNPSDCENISLITTILVSFFTMIVGIILGHIFTKSRNKDTRYINAISKFNEAIVADKTRLINETITKQTMGNVTAVQPAVENIKFFLNEKDIKTIDTAWEQYYKNEYRRKPQESEGPKRKASALEALETMLKIVNK